jgi:peptide deformylase
MDEDGQAMEMTCEDLMARVIQHETDHLDGKLIIDYADINEKAQFKEQLMALKEGQKKRA